MMVFVDRHTLVLQKNPKLHEGLPGLVFSSPVIGHTAKTRFGIHTMGSL